MPSSLIFTWQAIAGVLKRRGHTDIGGPPPGPSLDPEQLAGSAPIGTTQYPVPTSNVFFVDPAAGSNANSGSLSGPFQTVEFAISRVTTNSTIVCRGGTYHEGRVWSSANNQYAGIPIGTAGVTIQAYPNEAVWFDGSSVVSGWVVDGALWRHDGWTLALDRSPTFTFGVADDPRPGWSFVNPAYPTAAWPEQLFIDGVPKTQMNSKAGVGAGKFFIDQSLDQVFVGDDPTGRTVRISDLQTTISGIAAGVQFKGLGFRRYAPSQPHIGCVKMVRDNCLVENCWFEDISATALSFQTGTNMKAKNVTVLRAGCIGIHSNNADNLEIYRCRTKFCNSRFFNYAPATGGLKITRQRGFVMHECVSSNNFCKGLWTDESVSNVSVYTNNFDDNEQRGVSFELTGVTIFANNRIKGSGYMGLDFITSDSLRAWNNTLVSSGQISPDRFGVTRNDARELDVVQDNRGPMNASSVGLDTRYSIASQAAIGMDWICTKVESKNNIISKMGVVGQFLAIVEDYNKNSGTARDKAAFGVDWDGNFYNRLSTSQPTWLAQLPNAGAANGSTYFNLLQIQAAGYDVHSQEVTGLDALNPDYTIKAAYLATAEANARPLPADIAALVGQPVGAQHVGCWR